MALGNAARVEGGLAEACIEARADLLVTAKSSTSFDLVSTLVPHGVEEDRPPTAVVGAVGTGPHSPLVAEVTGLLAAGAGAEAVLVTVSRDEDEDASAHALLDALSRHAPGATSSLVRAATAQGLLDSLPTGGLLVLGAPGGSWWQRQFFGPGRRLRQGAPAGSVVVRAAPRRCFQSLIEANPLGKLMPAPIAATVAQTEAVPVAEDGVLVGVVRRHSLLAAAEGTTVGDLMEHPVYAAPEDAVAAIAELSDFLEGAPVPVVDSDGVLLGCATA